MARIRTIKPEFWQDERLTRIPRDYRLLFIGLWNIADDEGRLRGNPLFIRAQVFPYDLDIDVSAGLAALEVLGRIVRYTHDGESYVWIRKFKEHQRIEKPKASSLPEPPVQDASVTSPGRVLDESRQEGKGKEGSGRESPVPAAAPQQPTSPPAPTEEEPAIAFFAWMGVERGKVLPRAAPEDYPPANFGGWFAKALGIAGDVERLRGAYRRFLQDEWSLSRDPPCPVGVFIDGSKAGKWRALLPGQAETTPRPRKPLTGDPYADDIDPSVRPRGEA